MDEDEDEVIRITTVLPKVSTEWSPGAYWALVGIISVLCLIFLLLLARLVWDLYIAVVGLFRNPRRLSVVSQGSILYQQA